MLQKYLSYDGDLHEKTMIEIEKNEKREKISLSAFEELMEITYLHQLAFADEKVLRWVIQKSKKAAQTHWISPKQKWLGAYHEEDLQKGVMADLRLKWMNPIKEFGLVANKDLRMNAYIGEYTGTVRRFRKIKDQKNPYCFEYSLGEMRTPFTIDAREKGNLMRFINHSSYPNIAPVFIYSGGVIHVIFRASRQIRKDEELTYDYGPYYWAQREAPIE